MYIQERGYHIIKYQYIVPLPSACLDNQAAFFHDKTSMDFPCFSFTYLESLSTKELVDLAGTHGLDIPPDLERVFIIEELLYIKNDGAEQSPEPEEAPPGEFKELAQLPADYKISFVEALVRDPLWAFVFWEIKEHDQLASEEIADFEGYALRVVPLEAEKPDYAASFLIMISSDDNARYLGFPADGSRSYYIELCVLAGKHSSVLAASRPFLLPELLTPRFEKTAADGGKLDIQKIYQNPLAQLSGVDSFPLIQSVDRFSRSRNA